MVRVGLKLLTLFTVSAAIIASPCGKGTFECKDVQECIDEGLVCDQELDCTDGTDEVFCSDRNQDDIWNLRYQKRPDADREEQDLTCGLDDVPAKCGCTDTTHLLCNNAGLQRLPEQLPKGVTFLDLSGNSITELSSDFFNQVKTLKELFIRHNNLKVIRNDTFSNCSTLQHLDMVDNKIFSIEVPLISSPNSLKALYLDYNLLNNLPSDIFTNLYHLESLYLKFNRIAFIHADAFKNIPNLKILFLTGNSLSTIGSSVFKPLGKLSHLHLGSNRISRLEKGSFSSFGNLVSLTLARNRIRSLKKDTFSSLRNVTFLDMRENSVLDIDVDSFKAMVNLKSLDLRMNPVKRMPAETLLGLHHLEYVYFDEFYMCIYATHVKHCEPFGNGISSHHNLLENIFLRGMVWVVALLSLFGNLLVIFGRIILREDNKVHSFYIKNLSLADMLMGVYLFILGVRDMMYRGTYLYHDQNWRLSHECDFCGVLGALSSQVSVLTLAIITYDRYTSIMYPWYGKRKNLKCAYVIMSIIWMVSLTISILPIVGIPYFGAMFYRDNSVCIPLHLHDPKVQGWEYSAFMFIGVTFTAFSFMCYAYVTMYIIIHRSTENLRAHFYSRETLLAKRFFLIVLTDFLCWAPIMIFKFIAISGTRIDGNLYAWIVIFILPINSAINPLLYTLTTKLFREKVIPRICCGLTIIRKQDPTFRKTSSSSSSGSRRCGAKIRNCLERDLYEVGMHTLRCATFQYSNRKKEESPKLAQVELTTGRHINRDYLCFRTREAFSAVENRSLKKVGTMYFPLSSSTDNSLKGNKRQPMAHNSSSI